LYNNKQINIINKLICYICYQNIQYRIIKKKKTVTKLFTVDSPSNDLE